MTVKGEGRLHRSYEEIEKYVAGVKALVGADQYRIDISRKRQANFDLYKDYVISEAGSKNILMDLTADDFCGAVRNKHIGFEREILYIFGKDVRLWQRFGTEEEKVSLYIKLNKLENRFVIVVSFHKQSRPAAYAFK